MYSQVILLGVLASILLSELTGLSAGLVVPGYLALCLHSPLRILTTLLIAAVTVLLCRLLDRAVILYGRRRFAAMVVIAFLLNLLLSAFPLFPGGARAVGYLVPGILANECDRQGFFNTLLILGAAVGVITLVLLAVGYPAFG